MIRLHDYPLSYYIKAFEEGMDVQHRTEGTSWESTSSKILIAIHFDNPKVELRCIPKASDLQSVNMQVLVDPKIDCLFSDTLEEEGRLGTLSNIRRKDINKFPYVNTYNCGWIYCTPRLNYWFSSANGGCTAAEDIVASLKRAGFFCETKRDSYNCLLAYCITGVCKGFCWPWESKEQSEVSG